ncbi:hypothetical protein ACHHV8_34750 [Paenibacillus sp. TAB 01]|uniref:hypothetical protein n=1 Tax=Paenibacillus sp. TAB 01 TaxID=3368988 RepID=UPI0037505E40
MNNREGEVNRLRRRKPIPIFIQLLAGMFLIAALAIALTNWFNYRQTSRIALNRTADYTQESVDQLSAKIDVLLRQYDQASQMIAFDEKVLKALHRTASKDGETSGYGFRPVFGGKSPLYRWRYADSFIRP